jgi:beta-N-acetylhexosaminidase
MNDSRKDGALEECLRSMTLEEKVGQLFTFYNLNPVYDDWMNTAIVEWKVGGLFLDMESLEEPVQVHRLTTAIQETALRQRLGIPLFISADLVAGAGCKLSKGGAIHFPKNKAVGACGDDKLAYESGRITALESLALGINFNYSPVVDINNNPLNPVIGTHSFGEEVDVVSRMGTSVIRGYQDHGMVATAKHFPGHGDTHVDSHHALPVISFDRDRLENFELEPFRLAIAAGVDAVMVGHISVPALDSSGLPASLSYPITTGILREQLGFEGLIVTDGMSMKGVTSQFSQAEACVMALKAGADILLVCPENQDEGQEMVERVLAAAAGGEIEEARIDASVWRILTMKNKYGITKEQLQLTELDQAALNRPEHEKISLELARGALQESKDFAAVLQSAAVEGSSWTLLWDKQLTGFAEQIRDEAFIADNFILDSYESIVDVLKSYSSKESGSGEEQSPRLLIALTYNKLMKQDVLKALNKYAASRPDQIALIHYGSQYDLAHMQQVPALLMYDKAPSLQTAAAEFIKAHLKLNP